MPASRTSATARPTCAARLIGGLLAIAGCSCIQRPTTPIGVTPMHTGSFAGTYTTTEGTLVLADTGAGRVTGTFDSRGTTGSIDGSLNGAQLVGTAKTRDGRSFGFVAYLIASGIQISFDDAEPVRFTRAHRAPAPPPAAPAIAPSTEPAPPPGVASATGAVFRDELDGWEIRTPEAWRYVVRGPAAVFTSEPEAALGLIVVTFLRGVTAEQLEPGVGRVLAQLGAVQTGAPRTLKTRGGPAVIFELGGLLEDRSEIRARAFAIAGPTGTVSVLGITTPPQLDGLRRRVDELALSARFFTAAPNPAMIALAGGWRLHPPETATDRTLELCSDGSYFDSQLTELAEATATSRFHDTFTTAWTRRPAAAGRWTATGSAIAGTLRLTSARGKVVDHQFAFRQHDVALDGRAFARRATGRCR